MSGSKTGLRVLSIINIILASIILLMGLSSLLNGAAISTTMSNTDIIGSISQQVSPDQINEYVVSGTGSAISANAIAMGIFLLCVGGMYLPAGIIGCVLSGNPDKSYGFYVVDGIAFIVSIVALFCYFWWIAGAWAWILTIAAAVLEAICYYLASSAQSQGTPDLSDPATEAGF